MPRFVTGAGRTATGRALLLAAVALVVLAATLVAATVSESGADGAPAPAPRPEGVAAPDPIVFVHGFAANGAQRFFVHRFRADGFTRLYGFSYDADNGTTPSNRVIARRLGNYVADVIAETGASKVDLVAHSMGNLSARWCLSFGRCAGLVDDYVSLGAAHHGTVWAEGCGVLYPDDRACPELAPDSAMLQALNQGDETRGAASYTTLRSPADEVVLPTSSAMLAGARNLLVDDVDHWQLMSSPTVFPLVRDAVR